MELVAIGGGNAVSAARLVAVVSPDAAPIKRVVTDARERGMLIDATCGKKTKAVLVMDSDHIILSGLSPEVITGRAADKE